MQILFNSWESLGRILVIGVFAYIGLVLILRISGSRTLSKMNSFDFVITITLGSTFADSILQKDITLADALTAFALLVGLQYFATYLSVRSKTVDRILKADPILLYSNGRFLKEAMRDAHVTEGEVLTGMREQGFASPDQVQYVVLESNGEVIAVGKKLAIHQRKAEPPLTI